MQRDHVHLSETFVQAAKVGMRHGPPHVLVVTALRMHGEGHSFFLSENGVWLVEHVPTRFVVW
jgi:putative RNA 2'-phosphotransferase